MNRFLRLLTALGLVALTGCAAFPQQKVAAVPSFTAASPAQAKPSAYLQVQFFRGPTGSEGIELLPGQPGVNKLIQSLRAHVEGSGLFRSVSYDSAQKASSDLQLNLRVRNHGNYGAAMASGFVTGFTMGVIPGAATDNYSVELQVLDRSGQPARKFANDDAVRTWMGWIFLPLAGKTIPKAVDSTLSNQVRDVLRQAQEAGQLKPATEVAATAAAL
jgi:hypothetical protein